MTIVKANPAKNLNVLKIVLISGIGIIGLALAIKMIKKSKKMASGSQVVNDDVVRTAMELNTAIHPSRNWFGDIFTSANKDEIFRIAQTIKKFDDVAKEYQNLYNESLSHELQDALGDEYSKLLEILGKVKTGTSAIESSKVAKIAEDLFAEMDGLNVSRDIEPYQELYRLSDSDFKRVIEEFNRKHDDFRTMLNDESTFVFWATVDEYSDWGEMKEKLLARYDKLY
jgi:hypothetical protein